MTTDQAQELLRTLFGAIDAAAESVIITDAQGKIEYVNSAFETTTGYSRAEAIGNTPALLRSGKHDKDYYRQMWETILAGKVFRGTLTNRRKDGTFFEDERTIAPVRGDDGIVRHFVAIGRDVSERKALEAQLRQSQKLEAVGRLVGAIAHDFNNLMTAVLGHADIALGRLSDRDPIARDLQEIRYAGERATTLTHQLLAFSKGHVLKPKVHDLNCVVADIEMLLRRLIGDDIDLITKRHPAPLCANVDLGQLEQVIVNLAVNARDAMPSGGRLLIETRRVVVNEPVPGQAAGPHAVLVVTDTGVGMDQETLSRIFEPFFTTKGDFGTGLGLATVYGIVRQSGGRILVKSEIDRGSAFEVFLPEVDAVPEPRRAAKKETPVVRNTETILVVEDDPAIRDLLRTSLGSSGYKVLVAENGREALALADREGGPIHLLLTDLAMPEMKGLDVAERMLARRPEVRVLLMSGHFPDAATVASGLPFLAKPFTPAALRREIRLLLDGGRRPQA